MKNLFNALLLFSILSFSGIVQADDFYKTGGKRVDNIYDLTKYYLPGDVKREFILDEPVSDAWAYTVTGNDINRDIVTYKINGKTAHIHKPDLRGDYRGSVYMAPITGFQKGKNELVIENSKGPFMIVIHLHSGKEIIVEPDSEWFKRRGEKWVNSGSPGKIPEKKTRYFGTARPYGGLIEIKNIGKRLPVFKQGQGIDQQIIIPKDFYTLKNPLLTCEIENCWTGEKPEWGRGKGITGSLENDKRVYTLKLPAKEQGAYTITYSFGKEQGHARRAELIVVGRIDQKKVPAAKIFESLNKELVDTIKCASPKDPHKFMERGKYLGQRIMEDTLYGKTGKPKEVRYRETGSWFHHASSKTSFVTWETELEDINQLYLLEFDYPDNRNRVFTVGVVNDDSTEYPAEYTGICGGDFPLSNSVKTGRLLFYPRTHKIYILLANKEAGTRAAAIRFRIYKILDKRLPMANVTIPDGKLYMELNERSLISCVNMYPGTDYSVNLGGFGGYLREGYDQLRRIYLAMENMICYTRFCGENGYMPGSIMYNRWNYPSEENSDVKTDGLGLLAEMLSVNDLNLVLMSHYFTDFKLLKGWRRTGNKTFQRWVDATLKDIKNKEFADPVALVDKNGRVIAAHDISHPAVRKGYLDTIQQQMNLYGKYSAFKGIMVFITNPPIGISFLNSDCGFGDGTIKRFREDSDCPVPDFKGVDRFLKRHDWIMKNAKDKWINFKCKMTSTLIEKAAKLVSEKSDDGKLFVTSMLYGRKPIGANEKEWDENINDYYRESGYDIKTLKNRANIILDSVLSIGKRRSARAKALPEWYDWQCYSLTPQDFHYNGANTGIVLSGSYYENHVKWPERSFGARYDKSLIGSTGGAYDNYLHQMNVALAGFGASYIFNQYTDCCHNLGHELYKAEFAETFSLIPKDDYKRVDGSNDFVIARIQAEENPAIFYVTNLKAFDTKVDVCFDEISTWKFWRKSVVRDVKTGIELSLEKGKALINLGRYETKVFKCVDLSPIRIEKITPDITQVDAYKKQQLKGDKALEVSARVGDHGKVQLFIKNTGAELAEDFIKISRHDSDRSLEGTKWIYGPLKPGETQVVTIPGKVKSSLHLVEGIVHTPDEISSFKAGGRQTIYAKPVKDEIIIDGETEDWKNVKSLNIPVHIRDAGRTVVRKKEQMKKFPEIEIRFKAVWKKDGLYLLFDIPDKEILRNKTSTNALWRGDSVSVFLDLDPVGDCSNLQYSDDDTELIFAPSDGKDRIDELIVGNSLLQNALKKNPELLKWKSGLTKSGYRIEIKLANKMLKYFDIYPGKAIGFDIRLNALDSDDFKKSYHNSRWSRRCYEWHNRDEKTENHSSTEFFGNLVLEAPGGFSGSQGKTLLHSWKEKTGDAHGKVVYLNNFEKEKGQIHSYQMKLGREKRSDFADGDYSLKAVFEEWDGKHHPAVKLAKPIEIKPGHTYTFSAWVYSDKNVVGRIDFSGGPHTGYKNWWTIHKGIIFKKGWNRYYITKALNKTPVGGRGKNTYGGEEIKKINPLLRFYQKGTFFIDDFKVVEE